MVTNNQLDEAVPENASARPTLAEIAAVAGVSVATVSKVLNGRDGVSEQTRDRVAALLDTRGYSRRMRLHRPAPLIELLCFEIGHPFSAAVIAAVERIARRQGMGVVITGAATAHQAAESWVDHVMHRQPLGVILITAELDSDAKSRLRSRDIPIVTIDPFGAPPTDVPSIGSADWNGGHVATRHLVELGHTKIAIIKGPEEMPASAARLSGYRTALETSGIRVRPEWIRAGRFVHGDGHEQALALLSLPEPPTAIVTSSDLQALGVYDAARSLGLDVPGDLSVVGYGDLSIAQWSGPAMTTVHVPIAEMAEHAMEFIARLRKQWGDIYHRVDLPTALVLRASTAPPSAS